MSTTLSIAVPYYNLNRYRGTCRWILVTRLFHLKGEKAINFRIAEQGVWSSRRIVTKSASPIVRRWSCSQGTCYTPKLGRNLLSIQTLLSQSAKNLDRPMTCTFPSSPSSQSSLNPLHPLSLNQSCAYELRME